MEKMTFKTDRTTVVEGEIVEVNWDCPGSTKVDLTIDNGYKTSVVPLEISGSKRFRLNRSKGRTRLTLTAHVDGKGFSKTIKIKVKEMPVTKAETVDHRGKTMGKWRQWLDMSKWQMWWQRYKLARQAMPQEKRLASRIIVALGVISLLTMLSPALLMVGMIALMGYLLWVVMKR